ncbi:hypothetical protein A2230_05740 [candidate division WOR-1 bacterium RIFOXYA2_FULL_36_21]|uniref:Histidine kinase/HSP90-like ATPase domain-containing protein n=1 Tax=candidate division WOR-1 bacterium RIFOXYB2_FULL_36_35 TaxID=1802578 RepID=A0A1F4S8T6_UNCSA|nr:MAG: hypothetical protein A2230_05740 [candidate division WOR-1 bacterium RIFOXYA2_FULL_36_21]OGC16858.1 MAG: hypothetical protein A2290_05025 [candidate division WOR-1 bacterium RIFOXYB2_FULL_36_35]OGC18675.1 MAG: hypothetical protein A2282_07185 [candidate division WOR-1 bacterium RIFOXYA12_FULL_36_13]
MILAPGTVKNNRIFSSSLAGIFTKKPRRFPFGLLASFAITCAGYSEKKCAKLFKPGKLVSALERVQRKNGYALAPERMEPLIHRQSADPSQALSEGIVNAIEVLMEGIMNGKGIGRNGEGRLQMFRLIAGDEKASMRLTTKTKEGQARRINCYGVAGDNSDVTSELEEADDFPCKSGTKIEVNKRLTAGEVRSFEQYIERQFIFVRGVAIYLNGRLINPLENIEELGCGIERVEGRVEVTITDKGFSIYDNGRGMTAENLVKNYLMIGASDGEQEPSYDDQRLPLNLYSFKDQKGDSETAEKEGSQKRRVSILLWGVEMQGIEVEVLNGVDIAIEMGTGLRRPKSSDRVVFGREELARVGKLIEKILTEDGDKKWAKLNTLMAAMDKITCEDGFDLSAMVRQAIFYTGELKEGVVFVPNRGAFRFLKIKDGVKKIYLDDRLFSFDPDKGGLARADNKVYKGRGVTVWVGDFGNNPIIYEDVQNNRILNVRYANNPFMFDHFFNSDVRGKRKHGDIDVAYGLREDIESDVLEVKKEGSGGSRLKLRSVNDLYLDSLMSGGKRTREEAAIVLEKLKKRAQEARQRGFGYISLMDLLFDKMPFASSEINYFGMIRKTQGVMSPDLYDDIGRPRGKLILKYGVEQVEQLERIVCASAGGGASIVGIEEREGRLYVVSARSDVYELMKSKVPSSERGFFMEKLKVFSAGSARKQREKSLAVSSGDQSFSGMISINSVIDYSHDNLKFGKINVPEAISYRVYEILTDRDCGLIAFLWATKEGLFEFGPADIGDVDLILPETFSAGTAWASSSADYKLQVKRGDSQLRRVIRGDHVQGVYLPIFGYVGADAVRALGDDLVKKIENRVKNMKFTDKELYLCFVEKIWNEMKEIDVALFKRVIKRWDDMFDLFKIQEITDIVKFFNDGYHFYRSVVNGNVRLLTEEDHKIWVKYFREEDFGSGAKLKDFEPSIVSGKGIREVARSHDLSFYTWASRVHAGWWEKGEAEHQRLLEEFSRLEPQAIKVLNKRLVSTALGQELAPAIEIRENTQNAMDAQSEKIEIETSLQEKSGHIYHVTEYRDFGSGMTPLKANKSFLNIEDKNKEAVIAELGEEIVKNIGKNGIGFKTNFAEADFVRVKTSVGKGTIIEIDFKCVRGEDRKLKKIEVESYRMVDGNFQGTWIEVAKDMGAVSSLGVVALKRKALLKDMALKRKAEKYVGLVRGITVIFNNQPVCEEILDRKSVSLEGLGTFSISTLSIPDSRQLQAPGLWINDDEDSVFIPRILKRDNAVFEWGEDVELTRGRGAVMESKNVGERVEAYLRAAKMIEDYLLKGIPVSGVPYDYFYNLKMELNIPKDVCDDAEAINRGELLSVDYRKYVGERENDLIVLLSLIEVEDRDGKRISLHDLKSEVFRLAGNSKDEKIEVVVDNSLVGQHIKDQMLRAVDALRSDLSLVERAEIKGIDFVSDGDLSQEQRRYIEDARKMLSALGLAHVVKISVYSDPDDRADARGAGGRIIYRKEYLDSMLDTLKYIYPIIDRGFFDKEVLAFYFDSVGLLRHELVHAFYPQFDRITHGEDDAICRSFAYNYREIGLEFIGKGFNPLNGLSGR